VDYAARMYILNATYPHFYPEYLYTYPEYLYTYPEYLYPVYLSGITQQ
jgi:hypothetical protein